MAQTWHDLLFAHWPIAAEILRPLVPPELPLDTFDGRCWVAVAPFHMSGIRGRGLPPFAGLSRFPELNLRTYVNSTTSPASFSSALTRPAPSLWGLHAPSTVCPTSMQRCRCKFSGEEISYSSKRYNGNAEFKGCYRPVAPVQVRARGTLEHWLTERYCLYTVVRGRVHRAEVHHQPWPLQDAEASFEVNTMTTAAGIPLPQTPPLLHFSRRLEVLIWPLRALVLIPPQLQQSCTSVPAATLEFP